MAPPTLVFAPETLNLAEVTRVLQIAKQAARSFRIVFLSYDSTRTHHGLIEQAGFPIEELAPQLTSEQIAAFWRKNRGDSLGGDYFSEEDLTARVRSELALYERLNAKAVVTGFCLSTSISARAAGIPLVWLNHTTWFHESFESHGTFPDAIDYPFTRIVPESIRNWLARRATSFTFWLLNKGFNRVAARFGVGPFRGSELLEGDENLLAEPPGFSDLPIPKRLSGRAHFIGPLYGGLDVPIPRAVEEMPRDLPIVYFAMGSSGPEPLVRRVLAAFEGQPYRVIAPVGPLLRGDHHAPPNVLVTGMLPAERVNPIANVSVLHGGIGTLMTACAAGTPIVGIPNGNPEQEMNVECLVRQGMAIHLHKRRLTPERILDAIERLLADDIAREAGAHYRAMMRSWNGAEEGARCLEQLFGDRPRAGDMRSVRVPPPSLAEASIRLSST